MKVIDDEILNIKQAADLTGFSVAGLRYQVLHGSAPAYRPLGTRSFKFFKSELIAWIRSENNKSHPVNR